MARASSGADERRAERQHVRAVVLARVPRDRLGRRHHRADPRDLVRRNRRPDARAVDDDAGVGLAAGDRRRRPTRPRPDSRPASVVSVPRSLTARPRPRRNVDQRRAAARRRCGRCAIATVRMSAGGASDASSADARPSRTTVTRRSLSVSCASGVMWPPRASITVSPRVEHARVALGDDVERFHSQV